MLSVGLSHAKRSEASFSYFKFQDIVKIWPDLSLRQDDKRTWLNDHLLSC